MTDLRSQSIGSSCFSAWNSLSVSKVQHQHHFSEVSPDFCQFPSASDFPKHHLPASLEPAIILDKLVCLCLQTFLDRQVCHL